jgi:hypothetical protein
MNSWGERRKFIIEAVLALIGLAFIAIVVIATLYKTPSCTDGRQNGGETGIDCGGSCNRICTVSVSEPIVRFVQAVSPASGRTDVIAYIDNPNADAGVQHARFSIELRGSDGSLVASRQGTVNLPPSTTAPVYLSHVYDGSKTVTQAFLTLDKDTLIWQKNYPKPIVPTPSDIQMVEGQSPAITATLLNPIAKPLYDVAVVVTVFDPSGNAIAASSTLVPILSAQGSAPIVFTWNVPFTDTPARVEILPATGS